MQLQEVKAQKALVFPPVCYLNGLELSIVFHKYIPEILFTLTPFCKPATEETNPLNQYIGTIERYAGYQRSGKNGSI